MKLPLRFVDNVTDGYVVKNAIHHIVMASTYPDYDQAPAESDIKQIVSSVNNFPEAVRLLKAIIGTFYYGEDLQDRDILEHYQEVLSMVEGSINQFLTKLEEDEKDN